MALPTYQDYVQHFNDQKAQTDAFMKQSGKIYDPTHHSYVDDPNFISASQSPEYAAAKSIASKAADSQFTNSQPLDPKALQGYVDSQGNPAKAGITQNDLTSGKYSYKAPLSDVQQQALDQKAQDKGNIQKTIQGIIDQIQAASTNLNIHPGILGSDANPEQYMRGLLASHSPNRYADYLNNGAVGELGALTHDLLNIARFSPQEIEKFKGNIPSPYDTSGKAQYKMANLQRLFNDKFGTGDQTNTTTQSSNTATQSSKPSPSFNSESDAAKANLPKGTVVIIGGRRAMVQ